MPTNLKYGESVENVHGEVKRWEALTSCASRGGGPFNSRFGSHLSIVHGEFLTSILSSFLASQGNFELLGPCPDAGKQSPESGSETSRGQDYGPYAPQGARRARRRYDSPDPVLFNTTIFIEHEAVANEMRDDPVGSLHSRLRCAEHNIETLRTRQVADLRDSQGIRRDHRAIAARLDEVEEYASASTFREFITKIQRLESMLLTDGGGTVGEAIRLCTRRIDQQQATLDDVRSRVRAQEANMEWSEENSENISGRENRVADRRRRRGAPSQGIWRSPMPRTPPPPQTSETPRTETDQQALNRLFTAYNQCVGRTGHLEHRFDQFRFDIRRDATDMALILQGHEQRVNAHSRELRQLTESLEEAQNRIAGLDTLTKTILAHDHQVTQTIDKNTHSQTASVVKIIEEQEDLRKMVEELASRFDRSQDSLSTPQGEASTGVLLDMGDLKTKVARLIEQHTQMDGEVSFLKSLHESVEELGKQVIKWNHRLPNLTGDTDEDGDKLPTAIEVQEELTDLTNIFMTKFHNAFNRLQALENMVGTLEQSRDESWEAVSNRVSTLVESSVTSLSGRLTELENALHSQRTTPVVKHQLMTILKVWLRHMCLGLLRLARLFQRSLYRYRHHQWCHHLRFLSPRINYPHALKGLLILLKCSLRQSPISVL